MEPEAVGKGAVVKNGPQGDTITPMKVLVCGGREWDNYEAVLRELEALPRDAIIVHGACRGADTIAGEIAKALGHQVREYPADWARYGRGAGPIRNRQMLREERPDLVIGFHDSIDESSGTRDMLNISRLAGVQTRLVTG